MCGRYGFEKAADILARFLVTGQATLPGLLDPTNLTPRYNAAPSQDLPVVIREQNQNALALMRWGLVPSWAREEKVRYKMINARVETVAQRPSYRRALRTQRCLVPASFFYEWQPATRGKVPYVICRKDRGLFAFAGLWDVWERAEGESLYTFAILTRPPNRIVGALHNRMPLILRKSEEEQWLTPDTDPRAFLSNLEPYPDEELEAYPVSRSVNDTRKDGPERIQRADDPSTSG